MHLFGKTALIIFQGVILIQGILGIIINKEELEKGTCHSEELRVETSMECDAQTIRINIVSKLFQNELAHCENSSGIINCFPDDNVQSLYNYSSGVLVFITKFNHTHHAGYRLWVNASCYTQNDTKENVLLKPCVSGFRTSAYHNGSHVTISCEHESFKMSDKGIRVVGKEDLAHCWWNKEHLTNRCFGEAEALTNGFKLTTPYTAEMNISCKFDEQSIKIEAVEQTTTKTTTALTITSPTTAETTYDTTSVTTPIITPPTTRATTNRRTTKSPSFVYGGSGKKNKISISPLVLSVSIFACIFRDTFI
ncbi:uncharacterized protein LOC133198769 [Saccostrea echinata]|uniref:uncharacterized protein LOC133198769 n=1 Tax=Saccostrea echinata TaxID=191078 RepID=UPI002A824AF6|nr:uncharacterized protein LOC133198769 [Saccostrea echinata]